MDGPYPHLRRHLEVCRPFLRLYGLLYHRRPFFRNCFLPLARTVLESPATRLHGERLCPSRRFMTRSSLAVAPRASPPASTSADISAPRSFSITRSRRPAGTAPSPTTFWGSPPAFTAISCSTGAGLISPSINLLRSS